MDAARESTQHHETQAREAQVDDKDTMRAVVHERYGSSEVMHLARVRRPAIGPRDVLVRVRAAGLDRGVWHVMTGRPYLGRLAFGVRRPKAPVLGFDVAGTVESVGSAVTAFAPGDDVYGFGAGAFAEYAVVREDKLSAKPANLSFEQAAVVPVSAVTALAALTAGRLERGQTVLVTGASGGVGSFAVQLATAFGAEVTAVATTTKLDLVRSLGAVHVIDHTSQDFADGTRHYDLIVDVAGNPGISRLRRALTPRGTAVIVGGEAGGSLTGGMNRQLGALLLSPFVGQRLVMVLGTVTSAALHRLTDLIESGAVTPSLDRSYPLERAAEAMHRLEEGLVRGKVAITL